MNRKKIGYAMLGGLAASGLAYGLWTLYKMLYNTSATASQKTDRQIAGCKPTGCMLLSGIAPPKLGSLLGVVNFDVPSIEKQFYQDHERQQIAAKIENIKSRFGSYINQAARLTNVPADLIAAFIFIESAGDPLADSGNAFGLMQVSPAAMTDALFLEKKRKRLSAEEDVVLRTTITSRMDSIMKMRWMGDGGPFITRDDCMVPEFNIMCGSIYLGLLIDEETTGDHIRMDKVVVRYNRGYFTKNQLVGDVDTVYAMQPSTTKAYITKLLGSNGVMDILIG